MQEPNYHLSGVFHAKSDDAEDFNGRQITSANGISLTLARHPRLGFGEFNLAVDVPLADLLAPDSPSLITLAEYIQKTVDFICKQFPGCKNSYNIFFYLQNDKIYAKLMPRFPTSPLFIGYDIRLLPSNLEEMAQAMQQEYFTKDN